MGDRYGRVDWILFLVYPESNLHYFRHKLPQLWVFGEQTSRILEFKPEGLFIVYKTGVSATSIIYFIIYFFNRKLAIEME